jgi:tetratricopeptide (TPR) repeat protein
MPLFSSIAAVLLLSQVSLRTAAEWSAAGWEALRAGAAQRAAADFAEALRLDDRDAMTMFGAGVAAHLAGKTAESREQLVGALRLQPSLTPASLLLGEILYRQADLDSAIQVYEQALAFAPNQPLLRSRLDAWRREADLHGQFSQKVATHFTILFEGPPDAALASKIAEQLEADYWRIGGALGAYPDGVVQVVLYTKEQFRDITQSPAWAGGAYDGRIRIPVGGRVSDGELRRVLAHELTHAIVHNLAPRGTPQWLNEGLALVFEGADPQRARERLAGQTLIPLARLEQSFDGLDAKEAVIAYAESLVATSRLLELGGASAAYNLLSDLASGIAFSEAFDRAAMMSYAEFSKSMGF